jgi:hypothetical protein
MSDAWALLERGVIAGLTRHLRFGCDTDSVNTSDE